MSARDSGAARLFELAAQRQRMCEGVNQAITTVLNHGQFILGPEVARLEKRLADFCKAEHCIGCASGTDALQLVLMAEGIGLGDAVFVPAFTFVASAGAVVLAGATPIFVDISRDNFTMETSSLEAAILDAKRHGLVPRAVIAVDLFGQPADYPALRRIAEGHGLTLIADAAQSFGASLQGEPVGTLAAFTATSFYPTKPLGGMGDGGAIFTNSGPAAELLRSLRTHGHDDQRESIRIGLNSRLDTLQATILLEKLERFPREILARGAVAKRYSEGLKDLVQTPIVEAGSTSVWAQYTIVSEHRDKIAISCREAGVPTQIFYPRPLHFEAAYRGYPKTPSGLPNCEWLAQRVISLPMNAYLTDEAVDLVVRTVRSALSSA